MDAIEREARIILNFLYKELGLIIVPGDRIEGQGISGYDAVLQMKGENYRYWKEMEWTSYYIKFLLERQSANLDFEVIRKNKWVLFKKNHTWDIRVNSSGNSQIILTDVEKLNEKFNEGGYGLIVIETRCEDELNTEFRDWVDDLKGGKSAYTMRKEIERAAPRKRKVEMQLLRAKVYYWRTLADFQSGIGNWLDDHFAETMKNSDDVVRKPKYLIYTSSIPQQFHICDWNFNEDPEEFHETDNDEIEGAFDEDDD